MPINRSRLKIQVNCDHGPPALASPGTPDVRDGLRKRQMRREDSDEKQPVGLGRRVASPAFKRSRHSAVVEQTEAELLAAAHLSDPASPSYPLVTRGKECAVLDSFLERCLSSGQGRGGSLYLSGGPGTGKTCSARGAARARRLQRPGTRLVEINCMELQPCSLVGLLMRIIEVCSGGAPQGVTSRSSLESLLAAAASSLAALGSAVVVIVDEVDQLVRRGQATRSGHGDCTLESLFSLPRLLGSPAVALIAIANAVDLVARSATASVQGLCSSLLFEPYSVDQLRSIVKVRFSSAGDQGIAAEKVLGRMALELRVRQVAKRSGDCRHIVRLCEEGFMEALKASEAEPEAEAAADNSATGEASPKAATQGGVAACDMRRLSAGKSKDYDPLAEVPKLPMEQQVLLCALAGGHSEALRFTEVFARYKALLGRLRRPLDCVSKPQVTCAFSALEQRGLLSSRSKGSKGLGGLGAGGRSGRAGAKNGELTVELCVSRKALHAALVRANPMLQQCLE
ncbi:unnamed protein product [Polarella glacialis]|uniref:AAA+ ATPase domain-containing protein n=1 Tax=Polarella glacialis TaxID=89957 RepID=A0A813FZ46_POLGL|nr:unnamed protein product [Polarella glacialis]